MVLEFNEVAKFKTLPPHIKRALKNMTRNISEQRMKKDTQMINEYVYKNPDEKDFIVSMMAMGVLKYEQKYSEAIMADDKNPIVKL